MKVCSLMPELAEVQEVSSGLKRALVGRVIRAVDLRHHAWVQHGSLDTLNGAQIADVRRWGKRIEIVCEDHRRVVVSLGMTGGFGRGAGSSIRHVVCVLELSDGTAVHYTDPRRFGRCHVFADEGQAKRVLGQRIGPDGAGPWRWHQLASRAGNGRVAVKAALLDQAKIVSGLGNYLVDEILYDAQVAPSRTLGSLSRADWVRINRARMRIVTRALTHRGLTFATCRDVEGRAGSMSSRLQVFGRAGLPCGRCKTAIAKSVVAGRGTHWSPLCQPVDVATLS